MAIKDGTSVGRRAPKDKVFRFIALVSVRAAVQSPPAESHGAGQILTTSVVLHHRPEHVARRDVIKKLGSHDYMYCAPVSSVSLHDSSAAENGERRVFSRSGTRRIYAEDRPADPRATLERESYLVM